MALELCSGLFDQQAAQRLGISRVTRTTFAITANDEVYTIGASGDITTIARPVTIDTVNFRDTSTSPVIEYPMFPLTDDMYAAIVIKAQTSTYPQNWYYNPTYPNGTLTLWPVPTSTTLQLVIYAPQAWTKPTALSDSFSYPPGYERYIRTWLAMELAAPLEKEPSPWLLKSWEEARRVVNASNVRMMDLRIGPDSLVRTGKGLYSIKSDQGT